MIMLCMYVYMYVCGFFECLRQYWNFLHVLICPVYVLCMYAYMYVCMHVAMYVCMYALYVCMW